MEELRCWVEAAEVDSFENAARALDRDGSIGVDRYNLKRTIFGLKFAFDIVVKQKNEIVWFILMGNVALVFVRIIGKLVAAAAIVDVSPVC
eukprot:15366628-Ditylum_brightwellii.AAC.1